MICTLPLPHCCSCTRYDEITLFCWSHFSVKSDVFSIDRFYSSAQRETTVEGRFGPWGAFIFMSSFSGVFFLLASGSKMFPVGCPWTPDKHLKWPQKAFFRLVCSYDLLCYNSCPSILPSC